MTTQIRVRRSTLVAYLRRVAFSVSHATLDPDRACSAAQDGTRSLSKAAIRLTQMIKAGDTLSLRSLRHVQFKCAGRKKSHPRQPQSYTTAVCGHITAPQHLIELRSTLAFGAGVLP